MGMFDNLPSWLPEDSTKNAAARAGLLNFGAALMGGRGNIGQILGGGLMAGAQGHNGSLEQQQQAGLAAAQKQRWDLENQASQGAMERAQQAQSIARNAGDPTSQDSSAASLVTQQPPAFQRPTSASAAFLAQMQPPDAGDGSSAGGGPPTGAGPAAPIASVASLPQLGQPAPANMAQSAYDRAVSIGNALANKGFVAEAKPYFDIADKLKPKYSTDFKVAQGADGKLHNYLVAEDGTFKDAGLGVKPDMVESDLGGTKVWNDKNALSPGQVLAKTVTPGEQLQHQDQVATRAQQDRHWKAEQDASPDDAPMDPLAVHMVAQQYLAGDAGALSNFGRGKQGAANLNAVRLEVAKQANAAGMNGADIAAKMAEFAGLKAGQRTAGVRSASIEIAANEVAQLAPIALEASSKVSRSGYLPFGKAGIMFDSNTNDPAMRQFAMANTALVNAYGQAMARGGAATVSDKDHARELLSTAFDQPSYAAAVAQLQRETRAAQAAPKQVRQDLSDAVSGRPPKLAPVASLPKKQQPASQHPADISVLLNKYGNP
jgi:hypothetical protein